METTIEVIRDVRFFFTPGTPSMRGPAAELLNTRTPNFKSKPKPNRS
jgi:hypothetical protein